MSNTSSLMIKPILTGALVGLGNKYIYKHGTDTSNLLFGASVATGVYLSQMIAPMIPSVPSMESPLYNGKTVFVRGVELSSASLISYAANKYVLSNDEENDIGKKLVLIAGADFIAEYVTDFLAGRELSFFK